MKSNKPNLVIRMGAAHWDVHVRVLNGEMKLLRDFRKMTGKERSNFHREFMNAFRRTR